MGGLLKPGLVAGRALFGLGLVVLAGVAVWLLFLRGNDEPADATASEARIVSPAELSDYAATREEPIYWAGPQANTGLELTSSGDGSSFIRYLPPGTEAGDPRPGFLTVATYPSEDAVAALEAAQEREGAVVLRADGEGIAVTNERSPTSVYLAPSPAFEVEVYDPSPRRAAEIARSGIVQPVR